MRRDTSEEKGKRGRKIERILIKKTGMRAKVLGIVADGVNERGAPGDRAEVNERFAQTSTARHAEFGASATKHCFVAEHCVFYFRR